MTDAYDPSNVFAKILRGEIPSHKLYEDDDTFAFMDIMPRGDGHCLVIPKQPSRNILDVEPQSLAAVTRTVQKLARAVVKAFGADGVKLRPHTGDMADQDVLKQNADKIRAALA